MFGQALLFMTIPFMLSTIYFGLRDGGYYDTEDYEGDGTSHWSDRTDKSN